MAKCAGGGVECRVLVIAAGGRVKCGVLVVLPNYFGVRLLVHDSSHRRDRRR